jgi:hypothetical protein
MRKKINRIIAKPATGIYRDKQVEIVTEGGFTHVFVNGKELKNIQYVGFKHRVGELPTIVIEVVSV